MSFGPISPTLLARIGQLSFLKKQPWWMSALIWFVLVAPAQAALELRVAIEDGVRQLQVATSTQAVVRDASGRVVGQLAPGNAVRAEAGQGGVNVMNRWRGSKLWLEPSANGLVWIGDRWYRGRTLLVAGRRGLTAVNYVDLEQYLYSVLGGEMNGNWPQEALKAQAVAARSYALYQRQTAGNAVFDVGDTVAWQVYKGVAVESPGTQTAVNATAGQVLTYRGKIIEAVFHSSAGGYTENVENVWVQALPYLRAVPGFDEGTPNYSWVQTFSGSELRQRITGVGNILAMVPQRTAPSGRIITMRIVGDTGSRIMSGNALRNALDLKSTLFTVTPQFDASKRGTKVAPSLFQVNGRGFGHGLGMSQWGAYNLARKGYSYRQIVLHYYRGTTLSRIQVR